MQVIRAKTAGFCLGVDLALKKLDATIATPTRGRIATLGPIIHNPHVLQEYAAKGVLCLDNAGDARAGDCVLIRAHGVPREVERALLTTGAHVRDATCPRVKKAQLAIGRATANGSFLLLFGEANHPEVQGLVSYAAAGARVFGSMQELRDIPLHTDRPYVLASQTTQDRAAFVEIETYLRGLKPDVTVFQTICDATRMRQDEALSIARQVDVMVVVGGRESGNTRRLAGVAAACGIPTFHVESVEELDAAALARYGRVGLTAGASTPGGLINAAQEFLEKI